VSSALNLARPRILSILFSLLFLFFFLFPFFFLFSFPLLLLNVVRRPLRRTRPATRLDGSIDRALIKLLDELGYDGQSLRFDIEIAILNEIGELGNAASHALIKL